MNNNRVFVLGLDGATFKLILPWVSAGKLPAFAKLIEQGVWGELESVANQRSAAAWTSFMTGKNPGKHGIFEFYEYLPSSNTLCFINSNKRDGKSLWKILSQNNKKVGVINVPMTYPAEEVNGFLIAGLDSPGVKSKGFTYPSSLCDILNRRFGDYILEPGLTGAIAGGKVKKAIHLAETELKQKMNVCSYLMKDYSWDFFMIVLRSLDAVQHCFWKYMDTTHPHFNISESRLYGDTILNTYKMIDSFLGELMASLDDNTTLLVMSDHGFGQKHPATNQLNQWLESKGFLAYKTKPELGTTSFLARLYKKIISKSPRRFKEWLWETFPSVRNKVQSRLCFSNINWSKTLAYSDSLFPVIQINLRGRESQGIVEPVEEYRRLLDRLVSELSDLKDFKTGEKIVEKIFRKEELYHGVYLNNAPDLLVRWREDVNISGIMIDKKGSTSKPAAPPIPGEDYRVISGDHHLKGIFLACGRDIKKGEKIEGAHITDIAPSILYLMGLPVPDDMDGKVLTDMIGEAFLNTNKMSYQRGDEIKEAKSTEAYAYNEDESKEIHERLKGLGYVE